MEKKIKSPHIYAPKNIVGLLGLYRKMPQSLIYAGGTGILWHQYHRELDLPTEIISLDNVTELNYVSRTESYLEIGATASLNRLLGIGRHVVAPALFEGISQIATPVIRNQATLGGNIARRESWMDILPVLLLLDCRIELRRQGGSSWLPLGKFIERNPLYREGELISRIRIPLEEWNIQFYKKFPASLYGKENRLTVAILAKVQKGFLSQIRIALGAHSDQIIRNRELENTLEGKKIPLSERDYNPMLELMEQTLDTVQPPLTQIHKKLSRNSILWFLNRIINEEKEEFRPWGN